MKSPKASQNRSISAPAGSKPMPRVGGHTSNVTPSQGVGGGPGAGKGC